MSDTGRKSVTGGMATGSGQTTKVYLDGLSPKDKTILCAVMCSCKDEPNIGVKGQRLQQVCVSGKLRNRDHRSGGSNVYKPEVNYDMTAQPVPKPIMDSTKDLQPHGWLPGWIEKYWPGGRAGYEPGIGNIRRPDVVVVTDPSRSPTQDNLNAVVEMKFPGDTYSPLHQMQDRQIAGPNASQVLLTVDKCGCGKKKKETSQPEAAPATNSARSPAAAVDSMDTNSRGVAAPAANAPWNPMDELDPLANQSRSILNGLPRFDTPGAMPPPSPANSSPLL